ncbi:hypothetical protein CRUP_022240 [Coryphaenoides rupestris]|nr:hypothetical protein CRUP_022240 [Coryphaenoides rupestris]
MTSGRGRPTRPCSPSRTSPPSSSRPPPEPRKETLQLMRAKEICLEQRKHGLKEELYDIQAEVLRCEELLLTAQLASLRRQMTAGPLSDEQLVALQHKTRQLEARRGRITSKRAYLKNKKRAADEEEETRSAHVGQERRRTLLGLRSHSQRFPGQVTLKSSRLRLGLPHSRRRPGPRTTETSTQVASVQTDHSLELSPGHYSSDGHQRASSLPVASLGGPRSLSALPPPSRSCSTSADLSPSSASAPPLAPPPPPLPPPPPPPSLEDLQGEGVDGSRSPGGRAGDGGESLPLPLASLPLAPFSPRFFDSTGSPMDEVLASLKRGCFRLRKAELRVLPDPDDDDVSNNILAQIRQGVLLRKVRSRPADQQQQHRHRQQGTRGFPPSADALTRSIHEALRRIKEASPESESEDEGLPCTDWEN